MEDKAIQTQDWYYFLIEECQAIITEAVYRSRQELIGGYWELGERIVNDANLKKYAKGNRSILQDLSKNIGVGERTLYYAIKFYNKFPDLYQFLGTVEEGKNISWNKIVTKYLPKVVKEKEPKTTICPQCGYEW